MKLFIVLSALIVITVAEWTAPTKEEYMKVRADCVKSEGVPDAIMEKINKRQYDEDLGKEGRCFFRCTALKTGSWDDTNGYHLDKTLQTLEAMGLVASMDDIKKCVTPNTDNDDACTWAFKDYTCMWKNKYVTKKA